MKFILTCAGIAATMLLVGCEQVNGPDQCLRQEIFKQCVANIPKGPTHLTASGNDWDEVVSSCESSAYGQSIRLTSQIKPECRAY